MKITSFYTNKAFIAVYTVLLSFNLLAQDSALTIEEVIVTAEKRSESLQDISQAINDKDDPWLKKINNTTDSPNNSQSSTSNDVKITEI